MTSEIKVKRLVNFETAIDGTAVKFIIRDVANRTEADGTSQLCLLRERRLGVQAVLGQGRGLTERPETWVTDLLPMCPGQT
jgi:hypothetical protein